MEREKGMYLRVSLSGLTLKILEMVNKPLLQMATSKCWRPKRGDLAYLNAGVEVADNFGWVSCFGRAPELGLEEVGPPGLPQVLHRGQGRSHPGGGVLPS